MRALGTVVFVVGMGIAGAFAARVAPPELPEGVERAPTYGERIGAWWDAAGLGFSLGAAMMIGGGLLARRRAAKAAAPAKGGAPKADGPPTVEIMRSIREKLTDAPDATADAEALKRALDEVLEELVPAVLDEREALIDAMGLGPFAEMIGHFATMERNTARAWSALIDGVPAEIPPCLDRARDGIDRAIAAMESA